MQLEIRRKFCGAHLLKGYNGKCANLHGHSWIAIFTFDVLGLNEIGIAADFKDVKSGLDPLLPDHSYLNDWIDKNPTAENIAMRLFRDANALDFGENISLCSVKVYESEDCSAIATVEDVLKYG